MRYFVFLVGFVCLWSLAAAEEIELKSGDTLRGKVLERTKDRVVIEHPVLGRLAVAPEEIKTIRSRDLEKWRHRIEVGLSGAEGNSQTLEARLAYTGEVQNPVRRWKIDSGYWFSQSDGETETEEGTVGGRREWPMPGVRWFTFGQGRFDYDRFQDWDSRASATGGLGYTHVETPDLKVRSRYGLGAFREFGGPDNDIHPEGILAASLDWEIWGQQLSLEGSLYPQLESGGAYRFLGQASWIVGLRGLTGVNLKFGAEDEYLSETEGEARHNDLKYYAALTYGF